MRPRHQRRQEPGNLRFEALTQTNRQNHFTVIELWRDRKAAEERQIRFGHKILLL